MPIRVRRLLYRALVLLALGSILLPVFFFLLPTIWNDQAFLNHIHNRFEQGNYGFLILPLGFLAVISVLLLIYFAVLLGLFYFQSWSRFAFTGYAILLGCLWTWRYLHNPEWDFFLVWLTMHLIFLPLLLLCIWTPLVGGEFRRTAKAL